MNFNGLFRFFQYGAEGFAWRWRQEAFGMEVLFGPAQLPRLGQNAIDHARRAADIEMGAERSGCSRSPQPEWKAFLRRNRFSHVGAVAFRQFLPIGSVGRACVRHNAVRRAILAGHLVHHGHEGSDADAARHEQDACGRAQSKGKRLRGWEITSVSPTFNFSCRKAEPPREFSTRRIESS